MANTFKFGNGEWAVGKETVLAYNDENSNFKPLPFTFDRASTATVVNKDGLIETVGTDEPRIDFLNNTNGHLLLEPSRTNVVTQSVNFSSWNAFRATLTDNATTSPDGASNAAVLTEDTTINSHPINNSFSTSSGVSYTFSIFVKKGSRRYLQIFALNGGNPIYYDLETKSVGSGGSVEDYGSGWLRLIYTYTTNSTNAEFYINPSINGTSVNYTGDGSNSVYLYGAQFEAGSYPTSYIPTSGSTATRSAETCNNAGNSNVFNDSEGVLYTEIAALADDGTSRRISLSNGSTSNTVEILLQNSGKVSFQVKSGNSFQGGGTFNLTQTEYNKIAVKYKSNDLALWVNGSERSTDNSANTPIGLSELAFDNGGGGSDFYGKVKDIKVYNTALSDSELQALTS
jgi:hypothetical protein